MGVNSSAQHLSIGRGVYTICNDYARTHWKSADSVEQILEHISSYPKWKSKDLKESIVYLQSGQDYVYYQDSVNCYFNSSVCSFVLPKVVTPCELIADTSVDAFLRKIKVASVCFDKEGHVVYSALSACDRCVHKIQKEILKKESLPLVDDCTWIPLMVTKDSKSVQNYCTRENVDSNMQTLIFQYARMIWRQYPDVVMVYFGLLIPKQL